jgi:hypothetical protein
MDSRAAFEVSTFPPITDSLKNSLECRVKAYTGIHEYFSFLGDPNRENLSSELISVVFPNVQVALRIHISLMVSNCSGEIILTLEASKSPKPFNHVARQAELFLSKEFWK